MNVECCPISMLPHSSRLFLDFVERPEALAPFYVASAYSSAKDLAATAAANFDGKTRGRIVGLLMAQNIGFGASTQALANIERLRSGAAAVVTGQQVALFGGPLLTLLKAATAIRKAQDATAAGHDSVPIFWLATEDHDLAEADHVVLPSRHELHTLQLKPGPHTPGAPVGGIHLGAGVRAALDEAAALLGPGPWLDDLERCYTAGSTAVEATTGESTFGSAFARWISGVFAEQGLIVIDASGREFHALGASTLRAAITDADGLTAALIARDKLLADLGYHSQVLVAPQSSLLFLTDDETGARQPLRRGSAVDGEWQAGRKTYTEAELLAVLDAQPERLSPNALLRPVFQDTILPTSMYVGGPAEVAYFAQSQVLYDRILGRTTPIFPRLSATLVDTATAESMTRHGVALEDLYASQPGELAQRLGARSMPVEGKRKLAAAGNALDEELTALAAWMQGLDADLGRSAEVAASKMRYQMNRLRRLAATFQLQRDASLQRHVDALYLDLFPERHPQERLIGAVWFLSRFGESLPATLVENAGQQCPGHKVIYL